MLCIHVPSKSCVQVNIWGYPYSCFLDHTTDLINSYYPFSSQTFFLQKNRCIIFFILFRKKQIETIALTIRYEFFLSTENFFDNRTSNMKSIQIELSNIIHILLWGKQSNVKSHKHMLRDCVFMFWWKKYVIIAYYKKEIWWNILWKIFSRWC